MTRTKTRDARMIVADVHSLADKLEHTDLDAHQHEALIERADALLREAYEANALGPQDLSLSHFIAQLQHHNLGNFEDWHRGLAEHLFARWLPSHYPPFTHYGGGPGLQDSLARERRWYALGLRLAMKRCRVALAQTPAEKLAVA